MTEIIIKADRKAKAAMDEILERSDKYTGNGYNTQWRRYWKNKYLREFWSRSFKMLNEDMQGSPADKDEIIRRLEELSCGNCRITRTSAWADIRLRNSTYIISGSGEQVFITAFNAEPQRTLLSSVDTAKLIIAIDEYLDKWEQSIDEALLAYRAEKQACEMLKTTAMVMVGDLVSKTPNIDFKLKLQKNGRLACTLIGPNYWNQKTLFRTSWVTFREDFAQALTAFEQRLKRRFWL